MSDVMMLVVMVVLLCIDVCWIDLCIDWCVGCLCMCGEIKGWCMLDDDVWCVLFVWFDVWWCLIVGSEI